MSTANAAWNFVQSPTGTAVIVAAFGAIWRWLSNKDKRVSKIGRIASDTFDFVEKTGLLNGVKGADKLTLFLTEVRETMQHEGLGAPTTEEEARLVAIARKTALMVKPEPSSDKVIE